MTQRDETAVLAGVRQKPIAFDRFNYSENYYGESDFGR